MSKLTKKQLMQKSKQEDQAFKSKEAQLVQRMRAEGFALPDEFLKWELYFFNRSSYLRSFTTWLYEKISQRGGLPFIETDMTPHASLVKKIQERRGDAPTKLNRWLTPSKPNHWRRDEHKLSDPIIPAPSGDAGSEWLCV